MAVGSIPKGIDSASPTLSPPNESPQKETKRRQHRKLNLRYTVQPMEETDTEEEFSTFRPENRSHHKSALSHSTTKPIIFVDGEGANVGEPIFHKGKHYQLQNYALLSATFSTGQYRCIKGANGVGRLPTRDCLEFLLDLPRDYVCVGYGIGYDVEQMLYELPPRYWTRLRDKHWVRWDKYLIGYVPHKSFSVSEIARKDSTTPRKYRRVFMWWDMVGFFQTRFDKAVDEWKVATVSDVEFLREMKLSRSTFTRITDEVVRYNHMEGVHGVRIFEKLRSEWTGLELPLRRYDGAGAIASAMFAKNGVVAFIRQSEPISPDIMLRAYLGGRFDFSRQGFIGNATEYDINSAYPHIARNLPCLTHSRWELSREFVSGPDSLWHVRWNLDAPLWSPFPYRTPNGRIHYHSSGEGWYYGSEVERALQLYPNVEVLEGYNLIRQCDHAPFSWIEGYYAERQRLKEEGSFGEQVLKLGLNSVYGKLAQSKGHTPKYQSLIWAGMITSGTRAMILEAISHAPQAITVTATDAVITSTELPLHIDSLQLGGWKPKHLSQVCVVGNGLYCDADRHKVGSRGFDKSKLDWDYLRESMRNNPRPFSIRIPATDFFGHTPAITQNLRDLRCTWVYHSKELVVDVPEWKEERDGWLFPTPNPHEGCSAPAKIDPANLRLDEKLVSDCLPGSVSETEPKLLV